MIKNKNLKNFKVVKAATQLKLFYYNSEKLINKASNTGVFNEEHHLRNTAYPGNRL